MKFRLKSAVLLTAMTFVAAPVHAQTRDNIRIVGSSTVYPFAKAVASSYARNNSGMSTPIVEANGTGAGMKLFCAGVGVRHPDIAMASRRIKASEFKSCAANGVSQIAEIMIGLDGLSVATAKSTSLSNLTLIELYYALAKNPFGKPNPAKTWKDVNAKYPAIPIQIYGPPQTSGTRSSVEDLFMEPACAVNPRMKALKSSNEAQYNKFCKEVRSDGLFTALGENDNLMVQKLAANPGATGLLGYSYLEENTSKLKGISVNAIAPSYQSIASSTYPGARPLYIYVKNAHLEAIPGIKAYAAEFVREGTFGPRGYLKGFGLIALSDAQRQRSSRFATSMTPMTAAGLK